MNNHLCKSHRVWNQTHVKYVFHCRYLLGCEFSLHVQVGSTTLQTHHFFWDERERESDIWNSKRVRNQRNCQQHWGDAYRCFLTGEQSLGFGSHQALSSVMLYLSTLCSGCLCPCQMQTMLFTMWLWWSYLGPRGVWATCVYLDWKYCNKLV